MRLDFNVLWVEDQPARVKAQRAAIARSIGKEGFRLAVKFAASVEEAKDYLGDDLFGDNIDLILMDYDLGSSTTGAQGLVEARRKFPYKDIIFYSAQTDRLKQMVSRRKLEGIFCSGRTDLPETVNGVFEALVKKVLDIDHSRGIVMGATSDIDYCINLSLLFFYSKGDSAVQQHTFKLIKDRLKSIRKNFDKSASTIDAATHISEVLGEHGVYTSMDRLNLLRKVLANAGLHKDKHEAMKKYAVETVPRRNVLAHVRVQRKEFARRLIDNNGNELTAAEMKELRCALMGHHDLFEEILESLSPPVAPPTV